MAQKYMFSEHVILHKRISKSFAMNVKLYMTHNILSLHALKLMIVVVSIFNRKHLFLMCVVE